MSISTERLKVAIASGQIEIVRARTKWPPPGGTLLHAVERSFTFALCNFGPAEGWEGPPTGGETAGKCSRCLAQLRRAGFTVSWAGRIVPEES